MFFVIFFFFSNVLNVTCVFFDHDLTSLKASCQSYFVVLRSLVFMSAFTMGFNGFRFKSTKGARDPCDFYFQL